MLSWDEFHAPETPNHKQPGGRTAPPQSQPVSEEAAPAPQAPAAGSGTDAGNETGHPGHEELRGESSRERALSDAVLHAQQAVAEINRYSTSKIRLEQDPRLEALTVSGVFKVGKPDSFVLALETMHTVEATRTSDDEITLRWGG